MSRAPGDRRRNAVKSWYAPGHIAGEWAINTAMICAGYGAASFLEQDLVSAAMANLPAFGNFGPLPFLLAANAMVSWAHYNLFPSKMLQSDRDHYHSEIALPPGRSSAAAGLLGFTHGMGAGLSNGLLSPGRLRGFYYYQSIRNYPAWYAYLWRRYVTGNYPRPY